MQPLSAEHLVLIIQASSRRLYQIARLALVDADSWKDFQRAQA
jgi:hypothetical protein